MITKNEENIKNRLPAKAGSCVLYFLIYKKRGISQSDLR